MKKVDEFGWHQLTEPVAEAGTWISHSATLSGEFCSERRSEVSAITATSPCSTRDICRRARVKTARVIVEFGAGEGTLTQRILKEMPDDCRLIVVEINTKLAEALRRKIKDPRLKIIVDTAEKIKEIMEAEGNIRASVVISGIPLSVLPEAEKIVKVVKDEILEEGGQLVVYNYSPKSGGLLREVFGQENVKRFGSILNIPPIEITVARKVKKYPTQSA